MRNEHDIHHRGETYCKVFVIVLVLRPETVVSRDGFYPPAAPDAHGIYFS